MEVFGDLNKFHWYADRDQNPTRMDSRGGEEMKTVFASSSGDFYWKKE